jgi:uncharacterized protein (TIGR00255 family)
VLAEREAEVKGLIHGRFRRGKVDLSVSMTSDAGAPSLVEIDRDAVEQYVTVARELARTHGISDTLDAATVLSFPGVARVIERELPEESLAEALLDAVVRVLDSVEQMRASEGQSLAREFASRLRAVESLVDSFEAVSERVVEVAKERLRKRAGQLELETGLLDPARLHQEIVIAADRLDITEEMVRMHSHVKQFQAILEEAGPGGSVGRRLDFLLQEMGREANTMGSKANDADLAHGVVELKTEIERIREQVQNVE